MGNVLVVGSLNMDTVVSVKDMPKPGETILGKGYTLVPGGKGANQAYAAGKLGAKVQMIGCVGKDENGRKLLENLQSVSVDIDGIRVAEHCATGIAVITVDEKGENSIIVLSEANFKLDTDWIETMEAAFDSCDVVVAQLEIPLDVVQKVAELAKQKGKCMILDPAPAVGILPKVLLQQLSIIKPNETELQGLTGMPTNTEAEIVVAAKSLLAQGVEQVLVTLGEKGAMLVTKEGEKLFPARKVVAVDTTAAGDAFTAALAMKLAEGDSCEEAIPFATAVSSIVVTRKGAQTSIPSIGEVLEILS